MSGNQTNTNMPGRVIRFDYRRKRSYWKILTSALLSEGYSVSHLSRRQEQQGKVRVFRWDPLHKILDPVAFEGVDFLIQLAGANLGEKCWTKKRKEEIMTSRIDTTWLLHKVINENGIRLKAFISASASGIMAL